MKTAPRPAFKQQSFLCRAGELAAALDAAAQQERIRWQHAFPRMTGTAALKSAAARKTPNIR